MKIYLNDKKLKKTYEESTLPQILDSIKEELDDRIIKEIYINEVEVNEKYLRESLIDKEDIQSVKIITQKTQDLIKETLAEIDDYLPKLKKGCMETADLFRSGNEEKANKKHEQILQGIEWYIQSMSSIVNILNNNSLYEKVENKVSLLNKTLKELISAQENEDNILAADILEYEISEYIDDFISLNKLVIKAVTEGKSEKQ